MAEFVIRSYRIEESSFKAGGEGDVCMEISGGGLFPENEVGRGVIGQFVRDAKLTIGDNIKVTMEKI